MPTGARGRPRRAAARADLAALFPVAVDDVRLEIGFGGGEHLSPRPRHRRAAASSGSSPSSTGMAKMVVGDRRWRPLANVRLYDGDADPRSSTGCPMASLAGVDLLYPDPWPKKAHWKRRFVSQVNLERFARAAEAGRHLRFASDIDKLCELDARPLARAWQFRMAGGGRGRLSASLYSGWPGTATRPRLSWGPARRPT